MQAVPAFSKALAGAVLAFWALLCKYHACLLSAFCSGRRREERRRRGRRRGREEKEKGKGRVKLAAFHMAGFVVAI